MIFVRVTDDIAWEGVSIFVGQERGEHDVAVLQLHDGGAHTWVTVPEGTIYPEPTLRLPEDAARALLDGLVRFYQGAEETRALRKDYDAERGRVDTLLATVSEIAKRVRQR